MSAYDPMFNEEDLTEPDYYCEHGTFTGNPYGGDYLCGWCESGATRGEYEGYILHMSAERARKRMKADVFDLIWKWNICQAFVQINDATWVSGYLDVANYPDKLTDEEALALEQELLA